MINRIKVRLFLGILFCCAIVDLNAQNPLLNRADSLFSQQKYTEALSLYEKIYDSDQASSAMLLKMAFIQDGLNDYAEALFYLDKYYQLSADRNVVGKIEALAEANDLKGYQYNDTHYFLALLEKYRIQFTLLFLAVSLLLLVYLIRKAKEDDKPIAAGIIQIMVVAMIFAINNIHGTTRGIIVSNNTLLRSGPSAGAEPLEVLSKGHKVKVLDQDDVWTKVQWDGQEVYVRRGRIKVI
ncbi:MULTISPECIES: SH3 domain-containing protein [unclassified Ekhidna]|jgi:tetratricopeptide (TPR) repeat protein|uniref:SH3 domain-containing protein n=1 Tax=unclassified Ekhidna TaxID=2632188 RepID=UPI0032DFE295